VKRPQYWPIPVLTFLKYRYYTGPGIAFSIPNWKHYSKANNKEMRRFKQHNARQNGPKNNLSDIFNRLMDTSDPVILGCAAPKLLSNRRNEPLPREVLDVLANPEEEIVASQDDMDMEVEVEVEDEEEEEQEELMQYD
jgi:hypothetical protein